MEGRQKRMKISTEGSEGDRGEDVQANEEDDMNEAAQVVASEEVEANIQSINEKIEGFTQQFLFGILLLVYVPTLDPYQGYVRIRPEAETNNSDYEPLAVGEQICPERRANIISQIFFGWMTPLMQLGYKRPIAEKDVWKLDTWDETETLYSKFQKSWSVESHKPKPWLLRALCFSLGGRFLLGGLFKIGNDASQFVGPIVLNLLIESMQKGDPTWNGYIYAFSIFAGVVFSKLREHRFPSEFELRKIIASKMPDAKFGKNLDSIWS